MFGLPVSTVLSIVLGLINLAKAITSSLHDKGMLDAGRAQAIADAHREAAADVEKARKAGDEADRKAGGDPSKADPEVFERDEQ